MKKTIMGFCVFFAWFCMPNQILAQNDEQLSSFSFRPKGCGYITVGLGGVQGLRVGLKLNTTNTNSAELSIGTVPFLELADLKATIYGAGYNWYYHGDQSITAFFSLLAGYVVVTTTSDEYKGDLLLISPTLGIDYSTEGQLNLFLRMGFAGYFSNGSKPKTSFTLDLGAGWKYGKFNAAANAHPNVGEHFRKY